MVWQGGSWMDFGVRTGSLYQVEQKLLIKQLPLAVKK